VNAGDAGMAGTVVFASLVHIRWPLQVNHILHDEAAVSISLSAVLDLSDFIFFEWCLSAAAPMTSLVMP